MYFCAGPELQMEVSNSGHWIETEKNHRTSGGIGLENLQRRLALLYPGQHRMEIIKKEGSVSVRICIPANDERRDTARLDR